MYVQWNGSAKARLKSPITFRSLLPRSAAEVTTSERTTFRQISPVCSLEGRMYHAISFTLGIDGRGTYEITDQVQEIGARAVWPRASATSSSTTRASVILCENADPSVRQDLERYFARLVPDGSPEFCHTARGPTTCPAPSARSSPRIRSPYPSPTARATWVRGRESMSGTIGHRPIADGSPSQS